MREQRETGAPFVGRMTQVERVGATVRRETGPWTPTIHALLGHLRSILDDVELPEPLGIDGQGREVLSLIPGTVPDYPMPAWIWSDEVLIQIGQLLRSLHDASVDFAHPEEAWRLPAREPREVICHQDLAPYNVVFSDDGQHVRGVIDWDTSAPGPRIWDLAYVAYRWLPWQDPASGEVETFSFEDLRRRRALLLGAYGGPVAEPDLIDVAVERVEALRDLTHERSIVDPHLKDDVEIYERDLRWIKQHRGELG